MKKRLIIPIAFLLGLAAILLIAAIFRLYMEAEIQQRNIFKGEIQTVGSNVIDKIDAVLKGDTLFLQDTTINSEPVFFQNFSKKMLFDSITGTKVGLVKAVINFDNKNVIIPLDTIYFDTNYRTSGVVRSGEWEPDIDVVPFEDIGRKNRYRKGAQIDMDSNSIKLLNRDFLLRIIRESLLEENLILPFDFALYNSLSSSFVVNPSEIPTDLMLKSRYLFSLKSNDKFVAPHYLILYFPTERGFFLQRMSNIVGLIVGFLVLILFISAITLFALYRQKKVADIKNDFINNMTHELKTPISTISLACEAISEEGVIEDPNLKLTYISIIKDENERLKQMVNNVLQIAMLRKGQLKMNMQRINIHAILKDISENITLQISSKQGKLELSLDAKNSTIYADKTHIQNVIVNLIENAIKYSDKKPEIEIRTQNDKKHFILSVKDNGIGIGKKNQKHIFDDFYRIFKGNIHDAKGYGLGLGYVKKIIDLHGGSIEVASELKKWTIFTIYLPIKK